MSPLGGATVLLVLCCLTNSHSGVTGGSLACQSLCLAPFRLPKHLCSDLAMCASIGLFSSLSHCLVFCYFDKLYQSIPLPCGLSQHMNHLVSNSCLSLWQEWAESAAQAPAAGRGVDAPWWIAGTCCVPLKHMSAFSREAGMVQTITDTSAQRRARDWQVSKGSTCKPQIYNLSCM